MYKCYLVTLFLFTSCFVCAKTSRTNISNIARLQKHADLVFIENKGQIVDQNNNNRNDIDFKLAGNGINVFIGKVQLHYQFIKRVESNKPIVASQENDNVKRGVSKPFDSYRMDVSLVGANENADVITEEPQEYYENYYLPQCWNNGAGVVAHSYQKVTYKNVYPNIDWVLYIKNNQLEYDFVVHDGGNPKDIQIKYDGVDNLTALNNGDINAICPMGKVTEQKPYSYELKSGKEVVANFELRNDVLSFNTDNYKGTLVIDPRLVWGTYYGGNSYDAGYAVGCDAIGNVYMTGIAASNYNIATAGAYRDTLVGSPYYYNGFVVKFNSNGVRQWGTYYGTNITTWNSPITGNYYRNVLSSFDSIGNVYISGTTTSPNYIATPGSFQSTISGISGSNNSFLARFNTNGSLKWATYFGGNRGTNCASMACNRFGHVYISGFTTSDSNIASTGSFQYNKGGGLIKFADNDGYLASFDSSGNRRWATYIGGRNNDEIDAVACDNVGNVYFAGSTLSDSIVATTGSFKPYFDTGSYVAGSGNAAMFLSKFDSTGNRTWGTYLDKPGGRVYTLASDINGDVYICGGPQTTSFLITPGTYRSSGSGFFLTKFSSSGNRLWGTLYGGSGGNNNPLNLACDTFGTVYLQGTSTTDTTVASPGSYQTHSAGGSDAFLARFTGNAGQRLWGTFYGGSYNESNFGVSCDRVGNVYICGFTPSVDGISTAGSHQPTIGAVGAQNAYLAKFNSDTAVAFNQPYNDTVLCKGGSITVGYYTYMPYNPGNSFTVQLSDTNGNFGSPTTIGSTTATSSGTISCTIPSAAYTGSRYRIRIVASSPAFTSPDDGFNIRIVPNLAAITAATNSPICISDTLKLLANGATPGIVFSWTGPVSFTSTQQNPVINTATAANNGKYVITGSANSCASVKDSVTVRVGLPPKPNATSNSPICVLDSLILTATDSFSGVVYHWLTPDSLTTTKQNPVLHNPLAGNYLVWVSLPHCNSLPATVNVVLNTPTVPSVTITNVVNSVFPVYKVTYTAHVTGVVATPAYQWKKNGTDIPGAIADTIALSGLKLKDVISVIIHSTDYCSVPDTATAIEWPLDISSILKTTITVQPNPTTGIMQIENAEAASYMIKDITGKKLMTGNISNQKENVDISGFRPGMYFLQVLSADGSRQTFKLIKE